MAWRSVLAKASLYKYSNPLAKANGNEETILSSKGQANKRVYTKGYFPTLLPLALANGTKLEK
jgi:hypothetical protein